MIRIYADFNQPLSYLASQRVDALEASTGSHVEWWAVEHDRALPADGGRLDEPTEHALLQRAADVALADEHLPSSWSAVPHTRAAVAAYAESLSDGCETPLRRALFDSVFRLGRNLSSADDVRRVVVQVMLPELDDLLALQAGRGWAPMGVADPIEVSRKLGGTTTRAGGPLTSVGQERIDHWRQAWIGHGAPELPFVVTPLGELLSAERALAFLARQLPADARRRRDDRAAAPDLVGASLPAPAL